MEPSPQSIPGRRPFPWAAALASLGLAASPSPGEEAALPSFRLTFDAPGEVPAGRGEKRRIEATVLLHTSGLEETDPGAQGWVFFVSSTGCETVAATTEGTDAERLRRGAYFQHVEITACPCPGGYTGALGGMVLSLSEPATLPPAESPHSILRLTLEGEPAEDGGCRDCIIELVAVDDCNRCHRGQPYTSTATWMNATYPLEDDPTTVRFCVSLFLRGDANTDGRVDISDAIRTFMFLFLGATPPNCLDGADSNDDGGIDISDGVVILLDFFRAGTAIPAPGPFECGEDPTPDSLTCDAPAPCS